jgi:hypothetical protein
MSVAPALDDAVIRDELLQLDPRFAHADIVIRPYGYRTSHRLAELDVHHGDGTRERLILKDLGVHSLDEDARRAKPAFLVEPVREIEVYRDILANAELGTASCRGAIVRPAEDRYWLVLELLPGVELYQTGALQDWCAAASWLAQLHRRVKLAETPHLVRYDRDALSIWIDRAVSFSGKPLLAHLAPRFDELLDSLLGFPQGFMHGELFASNVIVDTAAKRVSAIDWETAGLGPQLLDLAALTAGNWTAADRTAMALAYRDAAESEASDDAFLRDLDISRLFVAVQRLGWSQNWTPPQEHAYDWASDVSIIGRKLGLL